MTIYSEIQGNKLKTFMIGLFFLIFASFVLYLIGKSLGLQSYGLFIFAFGVSLVSSIFSYYFSDRIILGLHRAVPANRQVHFDLFTVTENLAMAAGIPKPRVFVIDDPSPNAFATGRNYNKAIVVATTGLLAKLDRRELEGVVAHELSHIKNYDMLLMTIVSIMVGFLVFITDLFIRNNIWRSVSDDRDRGSGLIALLTFVIALLTPIIATLIQLSISRKREFLADASAAYLTRYPQGLALALEKIAADPAMMKIKSNATAHLFIENPNKADSQKKVSWINKLFSTHPPIEERIAKLRQM
jgi:heat shock protein HtpX